MEIPKTQESDKWLDTKQLFADTKPITLGTYFSHILQQTPRRLLFQLSYAKFAAKMIGTNKRILDVGCSEGLGTVILGEFASECIGLDIDQQAILSAQNNFQNNRFKFHCGDALQMELGNFDAVTCFDVIEHIYPENSENFVKKLSHHLRPNGLMIIGTPNITSDVYASPVTKAGHVNLYSAERLRKELEPFFHNIFIFSANDEIVHTGFYPMAHYLLAVGSGLKEG